MIVPVVRSPRPLRAVTRAAVVLMLVGLGVGVTDRASRADRSACAAPEAAQFDFWVGAWDVYTGGEKRGFNRIERIHGGCTVAESFHALQSPYEGRSFSWWEPADSAWHQVWVDNGGLRLVLRGGWTGEAMVLSGARLGNASTMDRITWYPNEDGTVRQVWEVSQDAGRTWKTAFDGRYVPATTNER